MTMTRAVTVCQFCKLLKRNDNGEPICIAFPSGIPDDIFVSGYDHRIRSYPGDNGILCQLDPDRAELVFEYEDQISEGFLKPPSAQTLDQSH